MCSLIKGEATWIVTKNNSTEEFSWPSSSIESMGISSLASVGFSSSLSRILYKTPTPHSKLYNMHYIMWSNNHQKKNWAEAKGQWKSAALEGLGYSGTVYLLSVSHNGTCWYNLHVRHYLFSWDGCISQSTHGITVFPQEYVGVMSYPNANSNGRCFRWHSTASDSEKMPLFSSFNVHVH